MPAAGQLVVVQIERPDRAAWINSVKIMGNAPAVPISSSRERITRLSALRSAATFAGGYAQSREAINSSDVFKVAESWLRWFEQGGDRPEGRVLQPESRGGEVNSAPRRQIRTASREKDNALRLSTRRNCP